MPTPYRSTTVDTEVVDPEELPLAEEISVGIDDLIDATTGERRVVVPRRPTPRTVSVPDAPSRRGGR